MSKVTNKRTAAGRGDPVPEPTGAPRPLSYLWNDVEGAAICIGTAIHLMGNREHETANRLLLEAIRTNLHDLALELDEQYNAELREMTDATMAEVRPSKRRRAEVSRVAA